MSRPWMPLYVSDYLGDTAHLSTLEHGAYLLLLMHYWQRGGLPQDDERLARIAGMRTEDWHAVRPTIRELFTDGWRHKRIDAEFAKAQERSKAGRMGGRPKANAKQNESKGESKTEAPQPQPHKEDGGGGDARASPLVSPEAITLAAEVASICGVGEPRDWPPGWCGSPMRAQTWLNGGYQREIIIATVHAGMLRKRDGPPDTINYFEKAIARAHAQHAAPLPVVVVSNEPEIIHAARPSPAGNVIEAADRLLERMRDFDRGSPTVRGRAGPADARLLSEG